ncbi:MAG TPA: serine/threonine-protein kinase [Planctomycetaceae bacterium]|nr:serine/threonine-protein kinase [Planctomycetaceae bacterium]
MVDSGITSDPHRAARNLLLGLLGLQLNLLSEDVLVEMLRRCEQGEEKSLHSLLLADQSFDPEAADLLLALQEKHVQLNKGSIEKSLACLSSVDSFFSKLSALNLKPIDEMLQCVSVQRRGNAEEVTRACVPGQSIDLENAALTAKSKSRFRIIRSHAKGGLGEVFLAKDNELNREVAVKEIQQRFAGNIEGRQRFRHEAEVTGRLEHPGIVPVYGFGQYEDGRPYYAMRFIRGNSLHQAIVDFHKTYPGGPGERLRDAGVVLELRKLLGRFVDICNAIDFAHSRGVLHRDLKPGNIVLGKYGETLVVDWGLAKSVNVQDSVTSYPEIGDEASTFEESIPIPSSQQSPDTETLIGRKEEDSIAAPDRRAGEKGSTPTMAGTVLGTPAFMSPEQASGAIDFLGPATDIYGLGAILYQMLSGRAPISGKSTEDVLKKVRQADFSSPRVIRPDIPRPLESICLKAMSKAPPDRYPTAATLAEDVERWLADEPVSAYRERLPEKFIRLLRKHRAWATAAAFSVVGIAITSMIAAVLIDGSRRAAISAQSEEANQRRTADKERLAAITARTEETRQRAIAEHNAEEALASSYLANIRLADLSLKNHRSSVATKALDACLPSPEARDLRAWEWHYLKSSTERSFRRIQTNGGRAIAFDSDNRRLVVDGGEVIDVLGEAIVRKLEPACGKVVVRNNICYGHVRESSVDNIYAWDLTSGKVVLTLQDSSIDRGISSMTISPDGAELAAAAFHGSIFRWSLQSGMKLPPLVMEIPQGDSIHCIAYSPDGTQMAAGIYGNGTNGTGVIRIWDTSTAAQTHMLKTGDGEYFQGAPISVNSVQFRPDGKCVYAGLSNGKVVEWDVEKEKIEATWNDHTGVVTGIRALKSNRPLITTSPNTIAFDDSVNSNVSKSLSIVRKASMAVSDDERWAATLDLSGELSVLDIERVVTGNVVATGWGLLDCVAVSDDGQQVAWGGNDGFTISHSEDWVARRTFRRAVSGGAAIHNLQFSATGHRLLSAGVFSADHPILWDTHTGDIIKEFRDRPGTIPTLIADGRQLLVAGESGLIRLDVDTGNEISRFETEIVPRDRSKESFLESLGADRVLVSPDERYAVTLRNPIVRWNLTDGHVMSIKHEVNASAVCGAWSEDGKRFAAGFSNGVIQLWDADRGHVLGIGTGHQGLVTALAFNRDGTRLASSGDMSIRIWDPSTMNELCSLEGHTQLVRDLCFSRDGHQIISVSWDRNVRIWDGTPDRSRPRDREMASAAIRFFRSQSADPNEVQSLIRRDLFLTERARLMALAILARPAPHATTFEVLSK